MDAYGISPSVVLSDCLSVDAEDLKLLSSSRLRSSQSDAMQLTRATLQHCCAVNEPSFTAKLSIQIA